jgi:tetratricopeptide (TPR) repeat protein
LHDYAGAISDFTTSIELDESYNHGYSLEYWTSYVDRGDSKSKLEDYRGALSDYNKAIQINKEIGRPYIERGIIKYNFLQDLNGACEDWSKAGELGRSDAYDLIQEYCN